MTAPHCPRCYADAADLGSGWFECTLCGHGFPAAVPEDERLRQQLQGEYAAAAEQYVTAVTGSWLRGEVRVGNAVRRLERAAAELKRAEAQPSITCPRCGMTSHHPQDVAESYCGACHDWTGTPP